MQRLATELTDFDRALGGKAPAAGYSAHRLRDAERLVGGGAYFVVVEFQGAGDPMFGGGACDLYLTATGFGRGPALRFVDVGPARQAFEAARKRPGAIHGVVVLA